MRICLELYDRVRGVIPQGGKTEVFLERCLWWRLWSQRAEFERFCSQDPANLFRVRNVLIARTLLRDTKFSVHEIVSMLNYPNTAVFQQEYEEIQRMLPDFHTDKYIWR